jgi:hypothetical protein
MTQMVAATQNKNTARVRSTEIQLGISNSLRSKCHVAGSAGRFNDGNTALTQVISRGTTAKYETQPPHAELIRLGEKRADVATAARFRSCTGSERTSLSRARTIIVVRRRAVIWIRWDHDGSDDVICIGHQISSNDGLDRRDAGRSHQAVTSVA